MNIHPLTGQITWTPTNSQIGNQIVEITAIDSFGATGKQTYTTLVTDIPTPNNPPNITSTPTPLVTS
jgi:hypothetical protein